MLNCFDASGRDSRGLENCIKVYRMKSVHNINLSRDGSEYFIYTQDMRKYFMCI